MKPVPARLTARRSLLMALTALALTGSNPVLAQPPARKIGFGVKVMTDGLLSQTVARIEVAKVSPGSQAQAAGVAVGDELVRIDDTPVPGNSAMTLKAHMDFVPGVPKKVTFKRPSGVIYVATFVRAVDPKGK